MLRQQERRSDDLGAVALRDSLTRGIGYCRWSISSAPGSTGTTKPRISQSIAEELGYPLDAFMFIDDSARGAGKCGAARCRTSRCWDKDLFSLRRTLLTDPGLQPVKVTAEAARRDSLVKAQLDRSRLRQRVGDETAFVVSLQVVSVVERVTAADSHVSGSRAGIDGPYNSI